MSRLRRTGFGVRRDRRGRCRRCGREEGRAVLGQELQRLYHPLLDRDGRHRRRFAVAGRLVVAETPVRKRIGREEEQYPAIAGCSGRRLRRDGQGLCGRRGRQQDGKARRGGLRHDEDEQGPASRLRTEDADPLRGHRRPRDHPAHRQGAVGRHLGLYRARKGYEYRVGHRDGPQERNAGPGGRDRHAGASGALQGQDALREGRFRLDHPA